MEYVDKDDGKDGAEKEQKDRARAHLNTLVAITVALLATFLSICNVKDGNIVQAMQQEQAKSIDTWSWYQARNIRAEIAEATAAELRVQATAQPSPVRAAFEKESAVFKKLAAEQQKKKEQTKADAEAADKAYDAYNLHDDQFDASEAFISLAITLLALTSLTQKRWLYGIAMVPTFLGVLMGTAGLFGWKLHSDFLARLLS
jgi:hypothetical protein